MHLEHLICRVTARLKQPRVKSFFFSALGEHHMESFCLMLCIFARTPAQASALAHPCVASCCTSVAASLMHNLVLPACFPPTHTPKTHEQLACSISSFSTSL
mmetsp:Transcript_11116/g.29013  ORF Transcript_11116/g.29013 Transcript_11116/m.29013 type:complete len:102 (-) Transcript_11116:47-352(-)